MGSIIGNDPNKIPESNDPRKLPDESITVYKKGQTKTRNIVPTIKKELGSGGHGEVYAHREVPDTVVKKTFANLDEEFALGHNLDHSCLIKSHHLFKKQYPDARVKSKMLMEKAKGQTIDKVENLNDQTAINMLKQAKDCCNYLYNNKTYWKDVNEGNIFVTPENNLKICDFGEWKVLEHQGKRALFLLLGSIQLTQNIIEHTNLSDKKTIPYPKDFFEEEGINDMITLFDYDDTNRPWMLKIIRDKLVPLMNKPDFDKKYCEFLDKYFDSVINEIKSRSLPPNK